MHNCCYHVPMQSQLFIAEFIAPILWQRREKKCINIGHRTGFGSVLVCQPQLSLFEGISLRVATVRRGNKKSTVVKTTGSPVNLTPLEDEGIRSSSRKRRHFFFIPTISFSKSLRAREMQPRSARIQSSAIIANTRQNRLQYRLQTTV